MRLILSAAVAALIAGPALAQYAAPAPADDPGRKALPRIDLDAAKEPGNPAIKTTEGNNPGAPSPGANSFTEGQAKARIEERGYGNVTDLEKDANGFWKGKAMKDGKTVEVTLDYQGNVVIN